MFEKASRNKIRFATKAGVISTEDLWDLPLTGRGANLDDIAKELHKELKEADEESFVVKSSRKDTILQLKFDIVKHVIDVKLKEMAKAKAALEVKAQKEKLLSVLAQKQDEDLLGKSAEEIEKMINELS